jgi:hypothetical protein
LGGARNDRSGAHEVSRGSYSFPRLINRGGRRSALPPRRRRGFKVKTTAGLRHFDAMGRRAAYGPVCACEILSGGFLNGQAATHGAPQVNGPDQARTVCSQMMSCAQGADWSRISVTFKMIEVTR